jgi:hypothetical protein
MSGPTFIAVGYPKVGNTWLRVTLGRYLYERYALAEMPLMDPAEFGMLASSGCQAIGEFTHRPLVWTGQTARDLTVDTVVAPYRSMKTVLLIRHPLDALVSLYMHEKFQNVPSPYPGSLVDFADDPVFGLEKALRFYRLWADGQASVRQLFLWRYEDATADPVAVLARLLEFLGESIALDLVVKAVAYGSFDNMKAIEASGTLPVFKSSGFRIFATGNPSNPNAFHVRKGAVGGYRHELPPLVLDRLERRVAREMPALFGYR